MKLNPSQKKKLEQIIKAINETLERVIDGNVNHWDYNFDVDYYLDKPREVCIELISQYTKAGWNVKIISDSSYLITVRFERDPKKIRVEIKEEEINVFEEGSLEQRFEKLERKQHQ